MLANVLDLWSTRYMAIRERLRRSIAPHRVVAFAKLALTFTALALVARIADPHKLLDGLRGISPATIIFALALASLQIPFVALRWQQIIGAASADRGLMPSGRRLLEITWIAQFFGQVLPFLAGDAVRALLLREAGQSAQIAVKTTVMDRAVALIGLFAIALPASMFSPLVSRTGPYKLPLQLFILAGCMGLFVLLALAPFAHRRAMRWHYIRAVTGIFVDLRRLLMTRTGALVCLLCLAIHTLSVIIFWWLAIGQGLRFAFLDALAIVPLILVVMTVPASIAGWGLREGFVMTIFGAAGFPGEVALLLSVSFGVVNLLASLPGSVVLIVSMRRRRPAKTSADILQLAGD